MARTGARAINSGEEGSEPDARARSCSDNRLTLFAPLALSEHRCLKADGPTRRLRTVALEVPGGHLTGVTGSEVRPVAAEDLGPLSPGVVDRVGDKVRHVVVAAARHADVRRGGAGGLADDEVGVIDGVALDAVHGGGVGELDVLVDVLGGQLASAR